VNSALNNNVFGGALIVYPYYQKDLFRETFIAPHLDRGGYIMEFDKWYETEWRGEIISYSLSILKEDYGFSATPWKGSLKQQRMSEFLHALQSLLSDYDAMIEDNWDSWQPIITLDCHSDMFQDIIYPEVEGCVLTAENIMNYIKEK
jgi:hypothetical protein